jgi:hypothetical protein
MGILTPLSSFCLSLPFGDPIHRHAPKKPHNSTMSNRTRSRCYIGDLESQQGFNFGIEIAFG